MLFQEPPPLTAAQRVILEGLLRGGAIKAEVHEDHDYFHVSAIEWEGFAARPFSISVRSCMDYGWVTLGEDRTRKREHGVTVTTGMAEITQKGREKLAEKVPPPPLPEPVPRELRRVLLEAIRILRVCDRLLGSMENLRRYFADGIAVGRDVWDMKILARQLGFKSSQSAVRWARGHRIGGRTKGKYLVTRRSVLKCIDHEEDVRRRWDQPLVRPPVRARRRPASAPPQDHV